MPSSYSSGALIRKLGNSRSAEIDHGNANIQKGIQSFPTLSGVAVIAVMVLSEDHDQVEAAIQMPSLRCVSSGVVVCSTIASTSRLVEPTSSGRRAGQRRFLSDLLPPGQLAH